MTEVKETQDPAEKLTPENVQTLTGLEFAEDTRTIHQRMIAVLTELPAIGKDQRNQQQDFMYRGHDDVLNALNPLLAEHGVFVVPTVLERLPGERTTQRGSTMYEVNLHVLYTFYGLAGDSIQASAWGEGTDSGDKSTNKAMTMAFKNVLAQSFAISSAELSDADATSPEPTTRGTPPTPPRVKLIEGAIAVHSSEDVGSLRRFEHELDKRQPWPEIEDYCCLHVFGVKRGELSKEQQVEFWIRLANAVAKTNELAGPGDFPPPTHEHIVQGYAFAFEGVVLALRDDLPASEPEADPLPPEGEADATHGR